VDRIRVADGVQLAVAEAGEGPAVVFVHGLGGSSYAWLPVLRLCADAGYRAIAYDQRGAGLSAKPRGPYSVELWASDLVGLLDARGIEQAALVGNSVGGMVAERAALALGERCFALAMVGSALEWAPAAGPVFAERERLARQGRMDEIAAAVAQTALSERCRAASPALHSLFAAMVAANDPEAYAESCAATAQATMEAPERVGCPALALCGELDPVTPPEASRAIAAAMPRCRPEQVAGAAHWCQVEAPEAVAEAVMRLLREAG